MKRFTLTALLVLLSATAYAQSSPGFVFNQQPTANDWNSYFAAKQDFLGFTPMNPGAVVPAFSTTGALLLPSGTTAQQPDAGNAGELRYNSTTGRYEFGVGGSWANHVRLSGDTMTGALTVPSIAVTGAATFSSSLSANGGISAPSSVPVTMPTGSSIMAGTNVKCDGLTDDTSAINTYLASLTSGGTVYIPAGKTCLINSGNLSVPGQVTLSGMSSPWTNAYAPAAGVSTLLLNPSFTVSMAKGSSLSNLMIRRTGLVTNPSSAQAIAAVAQWGTETSVGVTMPKVGGQQVLENLFIVGFNTGVLELDGRVTANHLWIDCYNGLEVATAGDNSVHDDLRVEPFYSLGTTATSGAWARPGIAFNFRDGDTLGSSALVHSFSFMYANAVVMSNIGVTRLADNGFEWQSTFGNGLTGAVGARLLGACAGCAIRGSYFNGFDTPVSVEESNSVRFDSISISTYTQTAFYFSGGGLSETLTLSGSATVGSTASVTLTNAAITGSPLTVTYTAVSGDTLTTAAQGLTKAINANQALIAAHITAIASGGVVTIRWPADATTTFGTASTGGLTAALAAGSNPAGSSGEIVGTKLDSLTASVPVFTLGNTSSGPGAWVISSVHMSNGTVALPSGWLSWPVVARGSVQTPLLSGIQWSALSAANLSSCGTGPSFASPNIASDARGTITEGTTATGCTLTFATPWPWIPQCIVTSPTGSTITSYAVTSTTLTIVNPSASGNKYTYRCEP